MKVLWMFIVFSVPMLALGQTQKIAHKSHSGTSETFQAKKNDGNNFGLGPEVLFWQFSNDSTEVRKFLRTKNGQHFVKWLKKQPDQYVPEEGKSMYESGFMQRLDRLFKKQALTKREKALVEDMREMFFMNYEKTRNIILEQDKLKHEGASGQHMYDEHEFEYFALFFGIMAIIGGGYLYKHMGMQS